MQIISKKKVEMKEAYDCQLSNKLATRANKTGDKSIAKLSGTDFEAALFDLEEVLLIPQSFESVLYDKR